MSMAEAALRELADSYGVATEFWDWQGRHTEVSTETITAVLAAFGVDASSPESTEQALAARRIATWARMLAPCVVMRQGAASSFRVHVAHGAPVQVWIVLEDGSHREDLVQQENWEAPREVSGRLVGEATFGLPAELPLGYHTLHARSDAELGTAALIVTPGWLGLDRQLGAGRAWGFATQLYSVRSRASWGVGDLVDLADLATWSSVEHGAGFVLVNPMHAAEPVAPMEPSPYLPTTRRFANPLYLRVERIEEYADLDADGRRRIDELRAGLHAAAPDSDRIDRDAAWRAKSEALQLIHRSPRSAGRDCAYRGYLRRRGAGLNDYATYCALAEEHGPDWRSWPPELQQPRSGAVLAFARGHAERVDFHSWLQWILDDQLSGAQHAARRAGMQLGVIHDIAVGVHPHGAETWSLQHVFAKRMTVGAPPDAYNQTGQDWSQPPWRPDQLAELAYEPFRQVLSGVLGNAGGVRVDHIIGLFRLWWIPAGRPAREGTYVRYDHEALVGILALEAHRAGSVVIGEDVGTVEPWVRDYLQERGILGTSILWFEFDYEGDGGPLPAERWREYCLASVTTHDLPPTAGYLDGEHVRLRESLGLLTRSLDEELATDRAEQQAWLGELERRQGLPAGAGVEQTVQALHRYLMSTPARLLTVALTDAVGERRTQNQPGTIDEYPNWRMALCGADGAPVYLEDVFRAGRVAKLAAVLQGKA
jgi:4-alpha-glucanotransferase